MISQYSLGTLQFLLLYFQKYTNPLFLTFCAISQGNYLKNIWFVKWPWKKLSPHACAIISCSSFNWKELQSAAETQHCNPLQEGTENSCKYSNPYTYSLSASVPLCSPEGSSGTNTAPASLHVLCTYRSCGSLLPHQFARKTYRTGGYWPATNYKIKNLCAKWAQLHQPLLSNMQTCQIIATSQAELGWSEPMSKA